MNAQNNLLSEYIFRLYRPAPHLSSLNRSVIINRVNAAGESTVMLFEERKTFKGEYYTEYGNFDMSIFTTRMHTRLRDNQVSASFAYELRFAGKGVGQFAIDVSANI